MASSFNPNDTPGAPAAGAAQAAPSGSSFSLNDTPAAPTIAGASASAPVNWSDVPAQAAQNLIPSAVSDIGQMGSGIVQAVTNPVQTAKSFYDIGNGLVSKLEDATGMQKPDDEREALVNNLGSQFMNRYGSMDALKQTLATDPFGVITDAATALSMATGAGEAIGAAKAGTAVGDVAKTAAAVARAANPIDRGVQMAGKAVGAVGAPVAGWMTGRPAATIAKMADNPVAAAAMRDPTSVDPVALAQSAVQKGYAARSAAYNASTAGTFANQQAIPFTDIDKAVQSVQSIGKAGPQGLVKDAEAVKTADDIADAVSQWKTAAATDPYYATAAGIDDLKQAVGAIRSGTLAGTRARTVADTVYNAAKDVIVKQNPGYANAMMGYSDASDKLKAIQKELSLSKGTNAAAAVRKLLSTAASPVYGVTAKGSRASLVDELAKYEPTLPSVLAGQAMSPLLPTGLLGRGLAAAAATQAFHPFGMASILAGAAATSPRVVGEAAYMAPRIGRIARGIAAPVIGAGRGTQGILSDYQP